MTVEGEVGQGEEGLWRQLCGLGWGLSQGPVPPRSLIDPGGRIGERLGAALAVGCESTGH